MTNAAIDLIFISGRWHVRQIAEKRDWPPFVAHFKTKDIALPAAIAIAKALKTELIIRKRDGSIMDRRSFGNDPSHRPG